MQLRSGQSKRRQRSAERLPPGQKLVKGWPVLHEGEIPRFDPVSWRFSVWGECENPLELDWAAFCALPQVSLVRDFHCVTTWSRYDNRWVGVAVDEILKLARPKSTARHVLLHSWDEVGYTTNIAFEDFARPDNLFATQHDGAPLTPEHGGPMRFVVHHLYAWKSAKWLSGVQLMREDQRGYWEVRGYHNRADPWLDERYSHQEGDE